MHNHRNGTNRRSILKAGALLTGGIAAPFVLRGAASAQEKILYVNTWGGIWTQSEDEAYDKPFTTETGIQIKTVAPVSYAKLKAQVQTGNYEWDCSTLNASELFQAQSEGLLEKIDWSVVNKDALYPQGGVLKDIGIATAVLSTNLCYRKDKFPNGGPQSWADFWDVKKFPGTRAFYDRAFTMVNFALLADGVPRDKLYPLDFDRAFKKLDEIKPHIKVFYNQGTQQQQLIKDGEIDLLPMWNARAIELIHQGVPIEMVWNQAEHSPTHWFVPKGTPRAKAAWQFAEFCARPDRLADFCQRMAYGPVNPKAFDFMKPEVGIELPTWPAHKALGYSADSEWLAPRLAQLRERWEQWKSG